MSGPIPFPGNPNVPIVGQPATYHTGFTTVSMTCNCEARQPMLLAGASPQKCPACGRVFVVAEFHYHHQTGTQVAIAQIVDPSTTQEH